ncbi:hypothetical protein JIG36_23400 [Actinoplanes sp. LDG1-06]|uniref:DUF2335 domain-containing protein n=1 Tax=Paractinoplanes ovalisporus TaxID=2810368 RepID=A0ABS2AFA1_9ACTN|nr:hypothetical protein [Actinoplanes ovalisporus]MBM2618507.1 hypothetical protein [Actinoplanes ovalisporus]
MSDTDQLTQTMDMKSADFVAEAVVGLPAEKTKETAGKILEGMPAKDAQEVARSVLPEAPSGIWYMLIGGLFAVAILFGFLTYLLINNGKSAEAVLGLATAALGGVVGLIAPSPLARS